MLAQGVHGAALIAFLSGADCDALHGDPVRALFRRCYAMLGRAAQGTWPASWSTRIGYPTFFAYTASLSLPGLLLLVWLSRRGLLDWHGKIATRDGGPQ